ncbi:hypothetical protein SUGI_0991850 [Cryptomeria japonica]|uniref:hsp70 nucleotide exchange factor FES1 n=1 Tax=Cryptomeria japonica TaxID=3369 RepID=UPI0024147B77|nr:hsp70 nucleotide exchange factor FES1 [Cryptomeria japonica]GLJ46992.1 hypothetical protein SUGI_0991850 [Cryptomeria japonica]
MSRVRITLSTMLKSMMVFVWVLIGFSCLVKAQNTVQEEFMDGGFPSLDSMLQWAVGHSDPEKLRGAAEETQRLAPEDLEKRRIEIKELLDNLRMPSDADLMKIAIADLNNSSLLTEDRSRALHELLELVEPIDNANDLNKLGGLTVVIEELNREEKELRTIAAWVLGKASHNNPVVQKQILELKALPKLIQLVKSSFSEEAVKALYAVSAIIRNNPDGQAVFYSEGGAHMLQVIMSNASSDMRLRKKSAFLVADLAEEQLQSDLAPVAFQADKEFLKSVVDLTAVPDLDTKEKALVALRSLIQLSDRTAQVLRDFCQLESALESLRVELGELMQEENLKEYASDVEAQRQEVGSIFQKKLQNRL